MRVAMTTGIFSGLHTSLDVGPTLYKRYTDVLYLLGCQRCPSAGSWGCPGDIFNEFSSSLVNHNQQTPFSPANTIHWVDVGLMLVHHFGCQSTIDLTLGQHLVFAGDRGLGPGVQVVPVWMHAYIICLTHDRVVLFPPFRWYIREVLKRI